MHWAEVVCHFHLLFYIPFVNSAKKSIKCTHNWKNYTKRCDFSDFIFIFAT